jgi:3-isopropylmalate/(R)-2-methylmalate dehydratase small subunit
MNSFVGRVWKYGDNVDTDVIIPARYLNSSDPKVLAAHCLEDLDPDFARGVRPGDLIVAGENFGCGSSREHAPAAIQAAGVAAVVAASFARIFFRNAINIGLPILECPEAAAETESGDRLEIDGRTGRLRNPGRGRTYQAAPFPPFLQEIIRWGGLIPRIKHELDRKDTSRRSR